jgi:hypothetical protein
MARTAMAKHVVRRQEETFVDWIAELRELAGERWPEISEQAPTAFARVGGATPVQALHMINAILPPRTAGGTEDLPIGRSYVWLRRFNGRLL